MTFTGHSDYDTMTFHINIASTEKSRAMAKYNRKKKEKQLVN